MRTLAIACGVLLATSASMVACMGDDDVVLADEPRVDGGQTNVPDATTSTDGSTGDRQPVELRFEAKVGERAFSCDESYELGSAATPAVLRDLRAYVHDVALVDESGARVPVALTVDGLWQNERVALLDFENGAGNCRNGTEPTNFTIRGTAPRGSYRGVAFTLGVPVDLNHADPSLATSPLTSSTMHWTWNAGYIFVRIDAEVVADGDGGMGMGDGGMDHGDAGMGMGDGGMNHGDGGMNHGGSGVYLMHLGSTGCTGESTTGETVSCSRPNFGGVELAGFDPLTTPIVVDVGALFAGSDLAAPDQGGSPGCMSSPNDPECGELLTRIGVDPATGASAPGAQKLFRAP